MAANPKIYCVNLDRSPHRWAFMKAQLDGLGLPYERIAAVDGQSLAADRLPEVAVMERVAEWQDLLTPNAIGCSLSHVHAYRRFLEDGGETAVFLEDDIVLAEGFAETAAAISERLPDGACALLYFHGERKLFSTRSAVPLGNGRALHQAVTPWGAYTTGAYMLGRNSAEAIASFNFPVYTTADSWGVYCRDGALNSLWAALPPVTSPAQFSSDIAYSRKGQLARRIESVLGRPLPAWVRRLAGSELKLNYSLVDQEPQPA